MKIFCKCCKRTTEHSDLCWLFETTPTPGRELWKCVDCGEYNKREELIENQKNA